MSKLWHASDGPGSGTPDVGSVPGTVEQPVLLCQGRGNLKEITLCVLKCLLYFFLGGVLDPPDRSIQSNCFVSFVFICDYRIS